MRVVIDTNALQSDELWGFLDLSPANVAVLPDYVVMEAYKPGRLDGLQSAFAILRQFPGQIWVLKGTGDISRLDPDLPDFAEAMVEPEETAALPDFFAQLDAASFDPPIAEQLNIRAGWAQEHMAIMVAGLEDMATAMAEFRAPFSKAELARIRRNEPFTPAMGAKFFDLFTNMAERIFEVREDVELPPVGSRSRHFIFRNALCYAIYMVSRIRAGSVSRKAVLARNDTIDVLLATFGTYFDGVMSEDALTNEIHHVAWQMMQSLGATTGGDYLSDYMMTVVDHLDVVAARAGPSATP